LEGDVDSQPLMGLNDLTHEFNRQQYLVVVNSELTDERNRSKYTAWSCVNSYELPFLTFHLLQLTSYNSPLTTYEHYDLLLRMIDKVSQIEEAKRDLPHVLELLALPSLESRKY
jgi:hypothetical protein